MRAAFFFIFVVMIGCSANTPNPTTASTATTSAPAPAADYCTTHHHDDECKRTLFKDVIAGFACPMNDGRYYDTNNDRFVSEWYEDLGPRPASLPKPSCR